MIFELFPVILSLQGFSLSHLILVRCFIGGYIGAHHVRHLIGTANHRTHFLMVHYINSSRTTHVGLKVSTITKTP